MLTYLHDIRNKLTLVSGHTAILSKKYGEDEFTPIKINLDRICELINDAYRFLKEEENHFSHYSLTEFIHELNLLTIKAQLHFSINILNEVNDFKFQQNFSVEISLSMIYRVIENAIDNSINAFATKINVRLIESKDYCIYEIVDNGSGNKKILPDNSMNAKSILPHGLGKEIMMHNMKNMGGKVEWLPRLDDSGMIVRLYFPKRL